MNFRHCVALVVGALVVGSSIAEDSSPKMQSASDVVPHIIKFSGTGEG